MTTKANRAAFQLLSGPPDRVRTGWRHQTRWLALSTFRQGIWQHQFDVLQRSVGAVAERPQPSDDPWQSNTE